MTLYFIGLGMNDEKDITLKGLEAIKKCEKIYLECYTSMLNVDINKLEKLYGQKIIRADRDVVENKADETILKDAESQDVAFLVVGDIFGATTHTDLYLRAKEKNIEVARIHNASIINAISETGLELYKFGKTTSIPFPLDNYKPTTAYDVILQNKKNKLHTLILLDIKSDEDRYMTVNQALEILLEIESSKKNKVISKSNEVIGCARIGSENQKIIYAKIEDLMSEDFGKPLHCIVIPGDLHFIEEDVLKMFKK